MAKTAVALYDTMNEARQVNEELANAGFDRSTIRIMSTQDGDTINTLTNAGLPRNDAEAYAEGIRRGGRLVMITTDDSRIDTAVDIMDRYNSINIEERSELWRSEGWSGYTETQAGISDRQNVTGRRQGAEQEERAIPVVEEELRVGKRQIERGGVRVHTHVEEKPVEETVTLRDEHVHVERRPANRTARSTDFDTFEEGSFEISEMDEEAVVDKQARVVEEVVVSKDVEEHQQRVRDTVRHTDVDVERVDGDTDFTNYREEFRTHYNTNYANTGLTYESYEPAYRYGYDLHNRNEMRGRSWSEIEPQARTAWERDNRGTWDRFKDAIRRGWESVRH